MRRVRHLFLTSCYNKKLLSGEWGLTRFTTSNVETLSFTDICDPFENLGSSRLDSVSGI